MNCHFLYRLLVEEDAAEVEAEDAAGVAVDVVEAVAAVEEEGVV